MISPKRLQNFPEHLARIARMKTPSRMIRNDFPSLVRHPLFLLIAFLSAIGLAACQTHPRVPSGESTGARVSSPDSRTFGITDMQIVRLSTQDAIRAKNVQVLVDPQGLASLFWMESPPDSISPIFIFRQRASNGDWLGEKEWRIENYYSFNPVLFWGPEQNPCLTFYDGWDSRILRMRCKTEAGWEEGSHRGYAVSNYVGMSLFVDGSSIVTAYTTYDDQSRNVFFFGETSITSGATYIMGFDSIRDLSGGYYLAIASYLKSDEQYRLTVRSSADRGRSWTDSIILSEDAAWSPRFTLARDGTLFLLWMENDKLMVAYLSSTAGWQKKEIDLTGNRVFRSGELFLGQDTNGDLDIALWAYTKVYRMHGSILKGFSNPELIWDMEKSAYRIDELSVAVGLDGSLYLAWVFFDPSDGGSQPAYFGWLPPKP
jgi:hypothetical protein